MRQRWVTTEGSTTTTSIGKYCGAAHNDCNLNLNDKHWKLPVFVHNGKNFDFYFIALVPSLVSRKFDPISRKLEKLTSITSDNLLTSLEIETKSRKSSEALSLTVTYCTEQYDDFAASHASESIPVGDVLGLFRVTR